MTRVVSLLSQSAVAENGCLLRERTDAMVILSWGRDRAVRSRYDQTLRSVETARVNEFLQVAERVHCGPHAVRRIPFQLRIIGEFKKLLDKPMTKTAGKCIPRHRRSDRIHPPA